MEEFLIENEEIFLSGELKGYPLKNAENKFDHIGRPIPFPGCSIISKIPIKSDLFFEIKLLQSKYRDFNPDKAYTYLPDTSFHMTFFDCCNINTLNTRYWPRDIFRDNNYKNISKVLSKRIKDLKFPEKFNLKLKKLFGGYSMVLEGNTKKDEKINRDYRNKLSTLLGIRFENHETYSFHITLAYILRKLKDDEIKKLIIYNSKLLEGFFKKIPIIQIKKPELCTFENMYEYKST